MVLIDGYVRVDEPSKPGSRSLKNVLPLGIDGFM